MSQSTARAKRKAEDNGTPLAVELPPTYDISLSQEEAFLMHNVCAQGTFPTVEAKRAAASLQQKLEALLPRE